MDHKEINTCHNCGYTLRNLYDFGRYQDGSVNTDFCYNCFRDGKLLKDKPASPDDKLENNVEKIITGRTRRRSNIVATEKLIRSGRKKRKSTV